jgi:SAM-dependent methyltransferase
MRLRDAVEMLAGSGIELGGAAIWADLGCGDGTFTRALAELLPAGSVIHAIDRDRSALGRIPSTHSGVRITTHHRDFTDQPWPFAHLDGILMANSLHYVEDQAAFIRESTGRLTSLPHFLIVEYDSDDASRWVPYPVSRARLRTVFTEGGYSSVTFLRTRPSVYRRASIYAAIARPGPDKRNFEL